MFDIARISPFSVGFERALKQLEDLSSSTLKAVTYPPYNIIKTGENTYTIEMAVAGLVKNNLDIELANNVLTIKGRSESDDLNNYIHKGIADRSFLRQWNLADTVTIKNAELLNGMLRIFLENIIPEEKKPKKIDIVDENTKSSSELWNVPEKELTKEGN